MKIFKGKKASLVILEKDSENIKQSNGNFFLLKFNV